MPPKRKDDDDVPQEIVVEPWWKPDRPLPSPPPVWGEPADPNFPEVVEVDPDQPQLPWDVIFAPPSRRW